MEINDSNDLNNFLGYNTYNRLIILNSVYSIENLQYFNVFRKIMNNLINKYH